MWIPLTPVLGADEVLTRLASDPSIQNVPLSPRVNRLVDKTASPDDVVLAWRDVLNADTAREQREPALRNLQLVAIFTALESLRATRYQDLKHALGQVPTATGRPMSIIGTRCELASRTAEGLYSEARRTPSNPTSLLMLTLVERLLSAVLADCKQKDNPAFSKRWLGIRGVCRLMTAVQRPRDSSDVQLERFSAAAADLEMSFQLGNRGGSAAAFLLDSLLHVIELSPVPANFARVEAAISSFSETETKNRSVLLNIARCKFARSFGETNPTDSLREALHCVNDAMRCAPDLSSDDLFVMLIRGQILVRLSISGDQPASEVSRRALDDGIADLKAVVDHAPQRFAKQVSLPSALYSRAKSYLRVGKWHEVKADVSYVTSRPELSAADPSMTLQLEFIALLADLRRAEAEDDLTSLQATLGLALDHSCASSQGLVALGMAARHLYFSKGPSDDPSLLARTINILEVSGLPGDPDSQRMHLSIRARLHLLHSETWSPSSLELAVESALLALEASSETPAAELLALAGECFLQMGKRLAAEASQQESAAEHFEQAAEHFERGVDAASAGAEPAATSFQLVVAYSKAGEAWLRLCRIVPEISNAERAVANFENAYELGNHSSELLGLLGDAYYYCFRLSRNHEMLDLALAKKTEAKSAGHASRENLSLSAKLFERRWEHLGDRGDLLSAVSLCVEAHEAAPTWPWPVFQLAELLETAVALHEDELASMLHGQHGARLVELFRKGFDDLVHFGCKLVVADQEFEKRTLGGRQPVYVLEDPHRLLSSSYVFKHTQANSAERDRSTVQRFSEFLRERRLEGLGLPKPVAVVPFGDDGKVVYVMRRAPGFHLGRLAIRARHLGERVPVEPFERALTFLAAFHGWGDTLAPKATTSALKFVREYLKDVLDAGPDSMPSLLVQALRSVGDVPQAMKKDAHPENWLIDERGRLSMLDFESTKSLPVPFELVQLLDDYPVLAVSEAGWQERLVFARRYLAARSEYSGIPIKVSEESLEFLYGVCLILRARFGLRQVSRPARNRGSSSSLRASMLRAEHYREVLGWLATSHSQKAIRDFAEKR